MTDSIWTPEFIAEQKTICEKATPGQWTASGARTYYPLALDALEKIEATILKHYPSAKCADLGALTNESVVDLVERVCQSSTSGARLMGNHLGEYTEEYRQLAIAIMGSEADWDKIELDDDCHTVLLQRLVEARDG